MPPNPLRNTAKYKAWRKRVLDNCEPVCIRCGFPVDMTLPGNHPDGPSADHEPPFVETGDIAPDLDGSGIAHLRCNKQHGGRIGNARQQKTKQKCENVTNTVDNSVFKHDLSYSRAPHRLIPPDNVKNRPEHFVNSQNFHENGFILPRLETARKAGTGASYGPQAAQWMQDVIGITLRPWQRYVVDRALEHDEEGRLIWPVVVVSVARQSGKSWMARALCMWRLHKGRELFGDTQLVLHVANKRETAMEVLRPAGLWAVEQYGKRAAKWGNTSAGIEIPSGDRWIIHAANESAGVGYSVDMAFVDEAWKVKREVVDDAIAPTMAERPSPQMWLVSTAGDSTSDLLTNYRQRAIDSLGSPDAQVLLLEWSAPPEADPDEVETWRWASPEWSDRRENFLRTQWANIDPSSWKTQFLNQWVIRANHWLTDTNWKATLDSDLQLPADVQWNVAVESDFDGMGHAVAIAAPLADGSIAIEMQTFRTMREADQHLAHIRKTHPRTIIHVTPTYAERIQTPFEGLVGQREAPAATQNLLDLFDRQALRHNGSQTLQEHFGASTISRRQNGWVLTAPMGHGGVYGARAVMFAVWQASKTPKPVPVIRSRRRSA